MVKAERDVNKQYDTFHYASCYKVLVIGQGLFLFILSKGLNCTSKVVKFNS